MFNRKLEEEVIRRCNMIWDRVATMIEKDSLVDCERCGCLLRKETAHCVKKMQTGQEQREIYCGLICSYISDMELFPMPEFKDEILKTYYCKIHKPKK